MKIYLFILSLGILSLTGYGQQTGTFTDLRDGKAYKIVKIGNQTWMAENLNYTTNNSWCYNDSIINCKTYGRLYTWSVAKNVCPTGWHLPSDEEWITLITFLGGEDSAGGKLKSIKFWGNPNTGATDSSRFSGLPGGFRYDVNAYFYLGQIGYWWTTNEYDIYAYYRYLSHKNKSFFSTFCSKEFGLSIRCIKD